MRRRDDFKPVRHPYTLIVRPTATKPVNVVPTVDRHSIFVVHRFQRRTVPCASDGCVFCKECVVMEDRIFLPGREQEFGNPVIVDLPASHNERLVDIANRAGSLRKARLLIARLKPRNNAPIGIKAFGVDEGCHVGRVVVELDEQLDQIFAENLEFALSLIQTDIVAATESPRLADRQPSRLPTPRKRPCVRTHGRKE